jgi:hypothetical protein
MPKPSIFMGSTSVPVHRTISEVQRVLVRSGAKQIAQEYGNSGEITGMEFSIHVGTALLRFNLPVRTERVYDTIHSARKNAVDKYEERDRMDAERVAWRQLLRWIEAQMALCDAGMAQAHEVFMPYAIDKSGRTMFDIWTAQLALPAPQGKS